MIEILASVLVNNPVIAPALGGNGSGQHEWPRYRGADRCVRPLSLQDVATLAQALKAVPLAAGASSILMPGERGFAEAAAREAGGIPLPRARWRGWPSLPKIRRRPAIAAGINGRTNAREKKKTKGG